MNTDWTGVYTCKECHKTEFRWNHTATDHKEGEQLEDRRNVGENSCNCGDGTDLTGPILHVYDDDDDSLFAQCFRCYLYRGHLVMFNNLQGKQILYICSQIQ